MKKLFKPYNHMGYLVTLCAKHKNTKTIPYSCEDCSIELKDLLKNE